MLSIIEVLNTVDNIPQALTIVTTTIHMKCFVLIKGVIMESIQEYLIKSGFIISQSDEYFYKYTATGDRIEVPFSVLTGHNLESFKNLLEKSSDKFTKVLIEGFWCSKEMLQNLSNTDIKLVLFTASDKVTVDDVLFVYNNKHYV